MTVTGADDGMGPDHPEGGTERAEPLLVADLILDVPQPGVRRLQVAGQTPERGRIGTILINLTRASRDNFFSYYTYFPIARLPCILD